MTDQFIGRGEKVAVKILLETFPNCTIKIQVPIELLVKGEIFNLYDEIYQKATIDILMIHKDKQYAVRIQDNSHISKYKSQKDRIQREDIEDNGITVIDIFERESPSCLETFWTIVPELKCYFL